MLTLKQGDNMIETHNKMIIEHSQLLGQIDGSLKTVLSKLDSLETRIDNIHNNRIVDLNSNSKVITDSIDKLESKLDKKFKEFKNDFEKLDNRVQDLEKFKEVKKGQIAVILLGITGLFAVVTFIINKFILV